jgi:hypothetical protein
MAVYRLAGRHFSRQWRRSKNYSDHEIRWLSKKRGLNFRERAGVVSVTDKAGKLVAKFQEVKDQADAKIAK